MIDTDQLITLPPTTNFVTSGACYTFTMPMTAGQYSCSLKFTHDLGAPQIWTVVTQDGQSKIPCAQNFTFNFYVSQGTPTTTSCNSAGPWIVTGDGQPATCGGGGGAGVPCPPSDRTYPPASCADANDDGKVDISDPIFLLKFLFLGGSEPPQIDTSLVPTNGVVLLKTAQMVCSNNSAFITCPSAGQAFFGQDANFLNGFSRSYRAEDPNCDGTFNVVVDLRTGLMWQRNLGNPGATQVTGTFAQAQAHVDALTLEGLTDWRLPTVGELLSIMNFDINNPNLPAVDPIFQFGGGLTAENWTKTPFRGTTDRVWRANLIQSQLNAGLKTDTPFGALPVRDAKADNNETLHAGPLAPPNILLHLGNADGDVAFGITDAIFTLDFLFRGGVAPCIVPGPIIPVVGESVAGGRFLDNGDGTVTDNFTKLIWKKEPIQAPGGLVNWEDGLFNAVDLQFPNPPSERPWRMPNAFEMMTIVDFAKASGHVLAAPFNFFADCSGGQLGCDAPLWTSTTNDADLTRAYHLVVNPAFVNLPGALRSDTGVPVRFGPKVVASPDTLWVLPVHDP